MELDGIANAPMTAEQRVTRAQPVLSSANLSVADLKEALSRVELAWNKNKASDHEISHAEWHEAVQLAGVDQVSDLSSLLDAMHRAESAATMLKAGYRGTRSDSGELSWAR